MEKLLKIWREAMQWVQAPGLAWIIALSDFQSLSTTDSSGIFLRRQVNAAPTNLFMGAQLAYEKRNFRFYHRIQYGHIP